MDLLRYTVTEMSSSIPCEMTLSCSYFPLRFLGALLFASQKVISLSRSGESSYSIHAQPEGYGYLMVVKYLQLFLTK